MRTRSILLLVALASLVGGCASKRNLPKVGTDPLLRERQDNTPVDDEAPLAQLPDDVVPLEYDLNLVVDPSKETFSGFAAIGVRLTRPRSHMWLHGMGLQVKQAQVTLADGSTRRVSYQQLTPSGVVRLSFRSQLEPQELRLVIGYDAEIGSSLTGLYRVRERGRSYAFTQLATTHARRVFPCFDEPRFKTPYRLTLTVPAEMTAVSTTTVEAERESRDGSVRTLAFRETETLPTYLVAFAVGELEIVEAMIPPNEVRTRSVPLRGVTVAGKGARLAYALHNTAPLLEALERYVDSPYPYDKLDLVAVPDFSGEATENAGLITFSEWLLLLDPARAPPAQRLAFASAMAHALAHQWFGNLVTHRWWNDAWLNEAFATWMEAYAVQRWDPALGAEAFFARSARARMSDDSLASARAVREPIRSYREVGAIDEGSYDKGAALLRMFERFLGDERFQTVVRTYLGRFRNGVATAEDFFEVMAEVSDAKSAAAFFGFLVQPGVPTLSGRLLCESGVGRFDVRQSRYVPLGSRASPDEQWDLPVCIETSTAGRRQSHCQLVTTREASFELSGCPDWVLPNAEGQGYYRFTVEEELRGALRGAAVAEALSAPGRAAFVDSLRAAMESGELPVTAFFEALRGLSADSDPEVVRLLLDALRDARLQWVRARGGIERYAQTVFGKRMRGLGVDGEEGEPIERRVLRAALLASLVFVARDPELREEAARRGRLMVTPEGLRLGNATSEVEDTLVAAAVQLGGTEILEALEAVLEQSVDPRERRIALRALGRVEDPDRAERVRDLVASDLLRDHERLPLLLALSRDVEVARGTWLWLRANFRTVTRRLPAADVGRTPMVADRLCSEVDLAGIDEFFSERIDRYPGGPRHLSAALERVERCIAETKTLAPEVERYFGADEVASR